MHMARSVSEKLSEQIRVKDVPHRLALLTKVRVLCPPLKIKNIMGALKFNWKKYRYISQLKPTCRYRKGTLYVPVHCQDSLTAKQQQAIDYLKRLGVSVQLYI
jgi:hypothetical protein